MSAVTDAIPLPEVYYSPISKSYYRVDSTGRWISVNEDMTKKFLMSQGVSNINQEHDQLKPVDHAMLDIQSEHSVDYTGPLAGYMAGHYMINNSNVLVTESPVLIVPVAGEWPLLHQIFTGMFNDPIHGDQLPYLYGWLKRSLEGYYAHQYTQAQVLVFAGPHNAGKSLLQSLITRMFGGRSAKPYLYMTGRTNFNADLFKAEHLMVEDDQMTGANARRSEFGAIIKQTAVNRDHQCHGKHKDGLILTPIWRMTISLNDVPGCLQILPPIEQDIADKIMLFKITKRDMPMLTETTEEFTCAVQTLAAELPAFIYYLLNKFEIPEKLRSRRFGVTHYHHPDILAGLIGFSFEKRLLQLTDLGIFNTQQVPWKGTAVQLERRLLDSDSTERDARSLFSYSSASGQYLSVAAHKFPERVTKVLQPHNASAEYTIQPPLSQNVVVAGVGDTVTGSRAIAPAATPEQSTVLQPHVTTGH